MRVLSGVKTIKLDHVSQHEFLCPIRESCWELYRKIQGLSFQVGIDDATGFYEHDVRYLGSGFVRHGIVLDMNAVQAGGAGRQSTSELD